MLRFTLAIVCLFSCAAIATPAWAQFDTPEKTDTPPLKGKAKPKGKPAKDDEATAELISARGVQRDTSQKQTWKCGVEIRATGGPSAGLFGTIAVPTDWPEQSVRMVTEDITPNVKKVAYRTLEQGVKQMLITIPTLNNGEAARAIVTFEVERYALKPPSDTTIFVMPTKMPPAIKKHLAASPLIEMVQPKFRKLAEELVADQSSAWEKVEAIYNGVRNKVKWENDKDKGAIGTLNAGKGNKEDVTGVFVAVCRAAKVPARLVWVPDSLYAEFYLEDDAGHGYWIPCNIVSEKSEFGFITTHAPILQKGDNFKVPEKKEPQRFVAEFLTGKGGGGKPQVEFIRRLEGIAK